MNNAELRDRVRLLENERRLLLDIIGRLPGHVYWISREGVYLGCNDLHAENFGLSSRNDILGKKNADLFPKEEAKKVDEVNKRVLTTGVEYEGEELVSSKGNIRCYLSKKVPLRDSKGGIIGVLGVSMDVTERKRAERLDIENRLQEQQLESSKAFSDFIHQAAHDLTSPLCVFENVIKSCQELTEKHAKSLKDVALNIRDIVRILSVRFNDEEEKNYAMKEQRLLVHLALSDAVASKRSEYRGADINFHYHYEKGLEFATMLCDPLTFTRTISNIVNNAVDALKYHTGNVDVSLFEENGMLCVSVEDDGVGMSKEMLKKIRSQTKVSTTKQKGNGVGLTQLYYTITKYNGRLEVESVEGRGTKFVLRFQKTPMPKYIADGFTIKKGMTVIILDDATSIFAEWHKVLKKFEKDITVKYFSLGKDALEFIDNFPDKKKLFFLSDFYLQSQPKNGLTIILESEIRQQSMLVTNFYSNKKVFDCAEESGIKILPKQLISIAKISVV